MARQQLFFNPLRMVCLRTHDGSVNLDQLYTKPVSDAESLEEALIITMSKIVEATRILSKCIAECPTERLEEAAALVKEVHDQEELLTRELICSDIGGNFLSILIRLPHALETVGDELETIRKCYEFVAEQGISLGEKADSEFDQLFVVLLDIMCNTRDAFNNPNVILLKSIISEGTGLRATLAECRSAHWGRVAAGTCGPRASSIYLDIVDAIGLANDHLREICSNLLELKVLLPAFIERAETEQEAYYP